MNFSASCNWHIISTNNTVKTHTVYSSVHFALKKQTNKQTKCEFEHLRKYAAWPFEVYTISINKTELLRMALKSLWRSGQF